MEDLAFTEGGTVAEITALFDAMPPQTGAGMAALASAKLISGDEAAARSLAQKVWRENRLARNFEVGFIDRFGKLLTPEDHAARADRLLGTWFARRSPRRRRADAVRRLIPLLSPPQQKYVTARLSLYLGQKGAEKLARALPKEWARKPELARQRAQAAVRAKQYERAGRFLAKAPAGTDAPAPDGDWELRERVAKELIEAGKAELAYTITATARPNDENAAKEAAFLAGWVALRKRDDAAAARPHFERMLAAADGPLSTSKAHYWIGRAAPDTEQAQEAFAKGGAFLDTFHGALSRTAMMPPKRALALPLPSIPDDATVAAFKARDVIKAAVVADKAGLPRRFVRALFGTFAWRVASGGEILLSGAVADALGDTQVSVRAGKAGVARGHPHYVQSYPVHRLTEYDPLTERPPNELLLAIARQESEFNTKIISRAGARGVLQVMPITARDVCRIYRTKCDIKRLLTDEQYNTRIASAYIATQMRVVDDNMILTLTSYNAGPGRTRQWLRQRGAPRDGKRDPLDWTYQIPFRETRLYVQKVLSNLQVYRARLGKETPVQVDRDLGLRASTN
ncbi:MAG: lytic transglycosylase domain-containing protein [Pseudomonadota bacterium]